MTTPQINLNNISVGETAKIQDAMLVLNTAFSQTLLVVNNKSKLVGTITDGDIRRAILNGKSIECLVKEAMNTEPFFLETKVSSQKLDNLFEEFGVSCIPVVNKQMQVEEILFRKQIEPQPTYENQVLIMAGGFGKRLGDLTLHRPKPLIDLNGKPILEVILLGFISKGFKNFTISTHYLSNKIVDYFGDGSWMDININYIHEKTPLGTAGALGFLNPRFEKLPVIVTNGDIVSNINILEALNFHNKENFDVTLCKRSHIYTLPFGQILMHDGLVVKILEKPSTKFDVSAGIYVINFDQMKKIKKGQKVDMPAFIKMVIEDKKRVGAFEFDDYWLDIGLPDNLAQAKADNLEGLI